jgi:hypothetical protein
MACRRRTGDAGPKSLHGADSQAHTGGDFRIVIVADNKDLLGWQMVVAENALEDGLFPAVAWLVNGIHMDGGKERSDA